jgi:hypothetical protein
MFCGRRCCRAFGRRSRRRTFGALFRSRSAYVEDAFVTARLGLGLCSAAALCLGRGDGLGAFGFRLRGRAAHDPPDTWRRRGWILLVDLIRHGGGIVA